ncbi:MAG: histidinol-phosphate aminotransferase family protein [Dehalococcoidia bacterium]|nr:histidinol-phosphate aminotransferase family protein [Dehalococcoidia bacterium]
MEALGIAPHEVLDFSANLNPFGPPAGVMEAVSGADIVHYPDSRATRLRRSLSGKLGVGEDNVIVSSGSSELIRLAALAYFDEGSEVLIIEPTFGEYEVACRIAGASVIKEQLAAENAFHLDVDGTAGLIQRHCPRGVFLANPNNPSGRYISEAEFGKILAVAGDSLLILDEAYINFVENRWSALRFIGGNNLLVLRSMTKDYAMAGLRLGYGVAGVEIIDSLRRICPPWNVNAVAQAAGIAALESGEYLEDCRTRLGRARDYLVVELSRLGLPPLPSETNFFLVEVGDAAAFRRSLLEQKILVRDCTSFGLPRHVRIAPRALPECEKLIAAIEEILP